MPTAPLSQRLANSAVARTWLSAFALALALGVAACATPVAEVQAPDPNTAQVNAGWSRDSAFVWQASYVAAVDDKFVDRQGSQRSVKIEPGQRVLAVAIRFNRGYGTGPYESEVRLVADLKPGVAYQLKSRVVEFEAEAWLEVAGTEGPVVPPARAIFSKAPPQRAVIPVFIPGVGAVFVPGPKSQ